MRTGNTLYAGISYGGMSSRVRGQHFTDKHGREWWAFVDKANAQPTSGPHPLGWTPVNGDWMPPPHFVTVDGDELDIDYDGWIAERERDIKEYRERELIEGVNLHGQGWDPKSDPTPAMIAKLGRRPPSSEPIKAMKQGNKFALGLTKEVDPRLEKFLPVTPKVDEIDYSEDYSDAPEVVEPVVAKNKGGRPRKVESNG